MAVVAVAAGDFHCGELEAVGAALGAHHRGEGHLLVAAGVDGAGVDIESYGELVAVAGHLDVADFQECFLCGGECRHGGGRHGCGGKYAEYGVRFHCQNV